MKTLGLLLLSIFQLAQASVNDVYKQVPFSSQFKEDGALIRNVNYLAVKSYIPIIEKKYKIELESRGEAHITVITPPEAQGWFTDKKGINFLISTAELQEKYSQSMQNTGFKVKCIGRQKNKKGNTVFYLVVDSPDLMEIRKEIEAEVLLRAKFTNKKVYFKAQDFYPHITIGYVGGDVHGVSKGADTCVISI